MPSWIRRAFRSSHRQRGTGRARLNLEALEDRLVLSPPGSGWQLLWSDEFNGTSLDTSKWAVATGTRRDATNTAGAVGESGGYLTITTYTSGGTHYTGFIGTYNSFKATYGYWEARINFQNSPGEWSAFWEQSPTIGNPLGNPAVAGTEIDTVEHRAVDNTGANISNKAESNLHWDGYGSSEHSAGSGLENNPTGTSLQGNFHLYAVQWSPTGYQFYIDGTQVWSTTQGVSQRSEFIYLTSEVQNNSWAGNIPSGGYGSLSTSQTKMIVDYVHVWQKPVSGFADQALAEGTASAALPFQVTQEDGRTTTITVTSSNTNLLPAGSLVLGGGGANRTLTLHPAAGQTGYATVTVSANNGVVSGSTSFLVTVNAGSFHNGGFEDDAAGTGWNRYGGALVISSNQRSGSRALQISGSGGAEQVITGLSPGTTYTLGGYAKVDQAGTPADIGVKNYGGAQLTTTLTSTSYTRGTVTFTTGPTSTQATVFAYKPTSAGTGYFDDYYVFRTPTLAVIPDQQTDEDASAGPIPLTVGNVGSAPGTWTVTATSSNQALVPNGNIAVGGGGLNPSLVFTPAADQTGTATITVTVADSYGGSVTRHFVLTVLPVHLDFSVPPTVTAGVPFTVTVTAQDALNNTDTGYAGTVHLTASDGASADYTFTPADGGQHAFTLTLYQAQTLAVTGTDTADPRITGGTSFTVTPAAADHISFVVPDSLTAGAPFDLTVTVQDAYGNTVTGYAGTVQFTLAGPVMTMADYTLTPDDLGSHTFSNLVLNQTGTYLLTGTDTADPMLTGTIMFTVM